MLCLPCFGQSVPITEKVETEEYSNLELDLNVGMGVRLTGPTRYRWRIQPAAGIALKYHTFVSPEFRIHVGLSEHYYSATRVVDHPYPYVMDMRLKLISYNTRLSVGGDYMLNPTKRGHRYYVGASVYNDFVHYAKAKNMLYYVDGNVPETLNVKDSFQDPVIGAQLSFGIARPAGKLELRYWQDITTFQIEGIPMGKERRSYVGFTGTIPIRF
jgi:hypothetical protein